MLVVDLDYTSDRLSDADLRDRKRQAATDAAADLDDLYLGKDATIPAYLANLKLTADYKKADVFRLVDNVPERATDPSISLFGNYVDLLHDLRTAVPKAKGKVAPLGDRGAKLRERLRAENERAAADVATELRKAIEPSLRSEEAFFTRVAADNQGSLSRLFARLGEPPPTPTPEPGEELPPAGIASPVEQGAE